MRLGKTFRLLVCLALTPLLLEGAAAAKDAKNEQECGSPKSIWRRVTSSRSNAYCQRVYQARARLWSQPKIASELAKKALEEYPGGRSARFIIAHARLLEGDADRSHLLFQELLPDAAASRRVGKVSVVLLVAAGRAALLTGNYSIALRHYRSAVLLLDELPQDRERARVLIEAATAVSYEDAANGGEARSYLRLAKEQNAPLLSKVLAAALGLSFWRDGELQKAKLATAHLSSSWNLHWIFERTPVARGHRGEVLPVLPVGEFAALCALVAESVEKNAAVIHWEKFRRLSSHHLPSHLNVPPRFDKEP